MGDDLGCSNIQKHGEHAVLQNYLHDEDKGVREKNIFLTFWGNIVLHDSYQADEIVIEIGNKKFQASVSKALFKSFIKCVGDISCILKKLYYINFKFDYS